MTIPQPCCGKPCPTRPWSRCLLRPGHDGQHENSAGDRWPSATLARVELVKVPTRRVCAWCGRVLAPGAEPATHGICPGCFARQLPGETVSKGGAR